MKIGCAATFMVLIRGVRIARTYQQNQPEGAYKTSRANGGLLGHDAGVIAEWAVIGSERTNIESGCNLGSMNNVESALPARV